MAVDVWAGWTICHFGVDFIVLGYHSLHVVSAVLIAIMFFGYDIIDFFGIFFRNVNVRLRSFARNQYIVLCLIDMSNHIFIITIWQYMLKLRQVVPIVEVVIGCVIHAVTGGAIMKGQQSQGLPAKHGVVLGMIFIINTRFRIQRLDILLTMILYRWYKLFSHFGRHFHQLRSVAILCIYIIGTIYTFPFSR